MFFSVEKGYVSGGRIGLTLKVPLADLLKVTGGKLADIIMKTEYNNRVLLSRTLLFYSLVIGSVLFVDLEYVTFLSHLITCQIFIVSSDLVDHGSVWKDFHDTVGCCLYELMVM